MIHDISRRIIAYAVSINALEREKTEEYIYGLEITISVLTSYLSVLIIGLFMGMVWESLVFLFLFVLLRRFAGGFHFSSQIACYTFTCIISATVLLVIKCVVGNVIIYSSIMLVSSLTLLILSPVPSIEKPLDRVEKIVYRRIARGIVILVDIIFSILCMVHLLYWAKLVATTMCVIAISLIIGMIKQKLYENCYKT